MTLWKGILIALGISLLSSAFLTHSNYVPLGIKIAQWFNYIIARGFYFLLICMILTCFVISMIQHKLEEVVFLRELTKRFFNTRHDDQGNNDLEEIKNKLRETERNVQIVQRELDVARKSVSDLMSTVEDSEMESTHTRNDYMCSQVEIAIEIEKIKSSNVIMEKQLERSHKENERLARQLEVLRREARISEAAIKDQDNLNERLEIARSELSGLKSQLKGIKVERDAAVHMAAEHIYKMVSEVAPQKIDAIEEMIDAELRRVREEEEAAEDTFIDDKVITSPSEDSLSSIDSVKTNRVKSESFDQDPQSECSNSPADFSTYTNTNFSVLAKSQSLIESWTAAYRK